VVCYNGVDNYYPVGKIVHFQRLKAESPIYAEVGFVTGFSMVTFTECGKFMVNGVCDGELLIKPQTITVNGFEIEAPIDNMPTDEINIYSVSFCNSAFYDVMRRSLVGNCNLFTMLISRGVCHLTKENAIAHAKAMLGIDPEGDES